MAECLSAFLAVAEGGWNCSVGRQADSTQARKEKPVVTPVSDPTEGSAWRRAGGQQEGSLQMRAMEHLQRRKEQVAGMGESPFGRFWLQNGWHLLMLTDDPASLFLLILVRCKR